MAGCGYVCPVCEGKGYTDDGKTCEYCVVSSKEKKEITNQDWIDKVHNSSCCSDLGEKEDKDEQEGDNES